LATGNLIVLYSFVGRQKRLHQPFEAEARLNNI